ncbi:uncharacterized protein LOC144439271 [Glandiceps talaboti]
MRGYLSRLWQFHLIDPHDAGNLASGNTIQARYKNAERFGNLPRSDVKVQLLGDAGVGKTSLRKKLMGEKFDPKEGKTVGVDTQMCESVDVDERWRQISSEEDEYKYKLSWLIAKSVIEDSNGSLNTDQRGSLVGFLVISLLIVFSLSANIILALNFHFANRFVLSYVSLFLTFRLFSSTTISYKLAAGFSLALVFIEKLYYFNKEFVHTFMDPQISKLLVCFVYGSTSFGGFFIGVILSTSFCNGIAIFL